MNNIHGTTARTFNRTHPWIKFHAKFMQEAPPPLWINLGECASKCEHIAGVPLLPETAKRLYDVYLAKGALATTAIEGNTLSEKEVMDHLEGRLKLPPSREYLVQEIDNVVQGCNNILDEVRDCHQLDLTVKRIMELNRVILNKLSLDDGVLPGEIRQHEVTVARYRGAPREDCEYLLERLCEWLSGPDFAAADELSIQTSILKAILSHLYLAWIHPFGDGNGRTARLIEFQILISSGVPAPAAHLLSNHYNQTRTEYYRQLDQASRSGGNVLPFVTYAINGFLDGLKAQLKHIRQQQWDVAWENYVHNAFRHQTSENQNRRKRLVLDLSGQQDFVPFAKLNELTPRLAAAYAVKTDKTLMRDVNALVSMGLIEKGKKGIRARKEIILAFLPVRAQAITG